MHKKQQNRKKRKASIPEAISRYFRRNEGTTDYAQFAAPITLAGDFNGSVTFSTNGVGTNSTIFSGSSNNNAEIVLDVTGGSVRFFAYDSAGVLQGIASVSGSYDDSVLHYAEFSLTGTTASISVDGGVAVTAQWSTFTTGDIAYLYNRNGTQRYFDGILANLKIWDNGTLTHWLPMDDDSNILTNKAVPLGDELWTFGDLTPDGSAPQYGTLGGSYGTVVPQDTAALVTVSYTNLTGGVQLLLGDSIKHIVTGTGVSGTVTYVDNTGASNGIVMQDQEGGTVADSIVVSIRQADGYATIINPNAEDWQLYTQQENGDWLGQEELWTYGIAESTGTEGTFNKVGINGGSASGLIVGSTYRGTMTTSGLTAGELRLKIGTDSASIRTSLNDTVTSDVTAAAANLEVITGSTQPNAGATALIATKEVLKVA